MSEWVIPVEHETGVPLAIEPSSDGLPPAGISNQGASWHHAIFPKRRKELYTPSGFALRQARVEWTDDEDHVSYHHYFNEYMAKEWEFPKSIHQRFGALVLMAARYVPAQSIRLSTEGPSYVVIDEHDRNKMWDKGILRIVKEETIYEFVKDYILNQDLSNVVEEDDIEEFVYTTDESKRLTIGNLLLETAAEVATDTIRPVYLKAFKDRLMVPGTPPDPKDLIISEPFILGTNKRKKRARIALRKQLVTRYGFDVLDVA